MKGDGLIPTAVAVVILTLVAGGGGAFLGSMLGEAGASPAEETKAAETPVETVVPSDDRSDMDLARAEHDETPLRLISLKPVLTNIYAPPRTWLRIEAALVMKDDGSVNPEVLAAEIESDTLAFLRSVQLAQIEGTRGLLHLREDLRERARLRSPAVIDYLIQTMVAE
ncbi:flagellar basal body-associated FliL family protein [Aurantimonas marianensis]|uniref:Flagellar protein FliL n=1 Tax=Aurantimonas marianensis TaxID=2920428 RepID=A0A9X2H8X5_9HYPH|nr:flagellar basal body-associated FliL family protein [Aurantimonas marianensis]MCP3055948.1 flagellar basal body-associated FliL family protein [Aurantimonas marianensis]